MITDNQQVTIEKLIYGGMGLARIDGQVVLTPFVLPGERATIKPGGKRGGVLRAGLVSVEEKHPNRVSPACPYFEKCGGCQYQHTEYSYQLEQKVEILRDVLRRIGKLETGQIGVVSGTRVEVPESHSVALRARADGIAGGWVAPPGSHRPMPDFVPQIERVDRHSGRHGS